MLTRWRALTMQTKNGTRRRTGWVGAAILRLRRPAGRAAIRKTIVYMLVMGVICLWIAIQSYSLLIRLGLTPATASKIPSYAFFVGVAIGLSMGLAGSIREVFVSLGLFAIMGGLFWFLGLLLGAVALVFGFSEEVADWILKITFWAGAALIGVLMVILTGEYVGSWLKGGARQADAMRDRG